MFLQAFLALSAAAAPARAEGGYVALQAGTIHLVEQDKLIEGGGTILVLDGKIVAAGKDVQIPPSARVVDYGPDAVIVPGFVAADSPVMSPAASSALVRRRQDEGERATASARSTLAIRPSRWSCSRMARSVESKVGSGIKASLRRQSSNIDAHDG